jgi:hypothetical protein
VQQRLWSDDQSLALPRWEQASERRKPLDVRQHRRDAGAHGGIRELAAARVEDNLVGVARLGGEAAREKVAGTLPIRARQGEVVGVATSDRARDSQRGDEHHEPADHGKAAWAAHDRRARDEAGLTSATTSLLTGELDRAGFLDRREDNNDRRRTIVSLPEHIGAPLEQVANAKLAALRRTRNVMETTGCNQAKDAGLPNHP